MALRFSFGRSGEAPRSRLDGNRVYLRMPKDEDWGEWVALRTASRDFLAPWEPTWPEDPYSKDAWRRRMRRYQGNWRQDSAYAFFIFRQDTDELLGGITISNVRRGVVQAGNVGYWMGARHSGKKYMTEAVLTLFPFAFDELGLHRLEAACLPHNERSARLLTRVGFQQEGVARKYLCIDGQWQDHLLFGILDEDWRVRIWHARRKRREAGNGEARKV